MTEVTERERGEGHKLRKTERETKEERQKLRRREREKDGGRWGEWRERSKECDRLFNMRRNAQCLLCFSLNVQEFKDEQLFFSPSAHWNRRGVGAGVGGGGGGGACHRNSDSVVSCLK